MTQGAPHPPGTYEIRIHGHLDDHWSAWFGDLTVTRDDEGFTTLRGPVTDQAELHGLLAKVRDLGLTLLSISTIDAGACSASRPEAGRPSAPPSILKDLSP